MWKVYKLNPSYVINKKGEIMNPLTGKIISIDKPKKEIKKREKSVAIPKLLIEFNFKRKKKSNYIGDWRKSKEFAFEVSTRMQGECHSHFKGYYVFKSVKYTSSLEAQRKTGINYRSIQRWSKLKKNGWEFIDKN